MQPLSGEPLRQQYLAAMGIRSWLPRHALPGARPSPLWCWQSLPEDAASPAVARSAVVAAPTAERQTVAQEASPRDRAERPRIDVRALLGAGDNAAPAPAPEPPREAALPAEAEAPTAAQVQPIPAVDPSAIPRFRILLARYANCLVLNDLPLDPKQPVSPQHHRLLNAILAAVALGGGEARLNTLSWPMFAAASGHDQGVAVARLMLREEAGFESLPEGLPLLLLGSQSGSFLVDGESYGGPVIRGPSLNEMLRIPTRKAELWRQLQALLPRGQ